MASGFFRQVLHAKDAVVGGVLHYKLEPLFSPYGRMLDINIDSKAKVIRLQVLLEGETEPVTIRITGYSLEETDGHPELRFASIETSRAWMTVLARQLLRTNRIPLPEGTPLSALRLAL